MERDELKAIFDQQARGYDEQWKKTAPIKDGMLYLLEFILADLPTDARVLCVGPGTGDEIAYLARRYPNWCFTAVDPSGAMLGVCREKAENEGFLHRFSFHEEYLDSLPPGPGFDAATSFLVSQFMLEPEARIGYFREISDRLKPGGILASSDLAVDTGSIEYEALLGIWLKIMAGHGVSAESLLRLREAYAQDVAILPPAEVEQIIASGGFHAPVRFYQAGLISAWFAKKAGISF